MNLEQLDPSKRGGFVKQAVQDIKQAEAQSVTHPDLILA